MTKGELKVLIKEAYQEGANQLKKDLGLDDVYAEEDIKDLRSLIKAIQNARKVIINTLVQAITVGILGLLIAGVYYRMK